ncbi:MAG: alpha-glycosidase [Oscillospiraceae bacterium]|nr:alpha-glycosidase [Oscillospiraceae bacterium]
MNTLFSNPANDAEWRKASDRAFLSSFFSDETELFRSPSEPEPGQTVTIRLRGPKLPAMSVYLLTGEQLVAIPMRESSGSLYFSMFEAELMCFDKPVSYYFLIKYQGRSYVYQKDGAKRLGRDRQPSPHFHFRFTPGFHTPDWAKGAVQYQIMPDRFRNGDPNTDVTDGEYSYIGDYVRHAPSWDAPPVDGDYRHFYGGDLQGVMDKLDYLQSLGIEVIYFNPIFLSPSSHKYDTQDYEHVDPHLGAIIDDVAYRLPAGNYQNTDALRYIRRVTSEENLAQSDALFARLCEEIHKRGMRVILDGVFNHCGSFHKWMDKEGIYRKTREFAPGAYQSPASPYRHYFRFEGPDSSNYDGWWGHDTLPKLDYENAPDLVTRIIDIACHWAQPPYSIDGWRLDVAADLGHSAQFNHTFWQEFRRRLKEVNPNLLIIAEHYGDPSDWLRGDQWDSVMNYDAFMEPVTFFLTGLEKHSDGARDDLYQNGELFFETMQENMARFEWGSLQCAMNELSNHDHSRFLTRTNRKVGRLATMGSAAAGEGIDKAVFREAVVIQMTWPGAPTIYYGDEAGQVGWTDPDCRRTYPWGSEDLDLIELHRYLISLRRLHPSLRSGSLKPLGAGAGWIAYARFNAEDRVVTVCNNNGEDRLNLSLRLRDIGAEDGEQYTIALYSNDSGFNYDAKDAGIVVRGELRLSISPRSAMVLTNKVKKSVK